MLTNDTALLRAHQPDFKAMVRRRLKSLAPDRLNPQRVNGLRDDNPDKPLMGELARGMTVHRLEGFTLPFLRVQCALHRWRSGTCL